MHHLLIRRRRWRIRSRHLKSVKSTESSAASSNRTATVSTDHRIDELDQKWSDWFNRLEALLMARTLDRPQEPTFSTVKVALTHSPPANVVRKEPFIKPTDQPSQHTNQPTTSEFTGTSPPASKHSSASRSSSDQPLSSDHPKAAEQTATPGSQKPSTSAFELTRKELSDSNSDRVFCLTGHLWIYMLKRVNCLMTRMQLSSTPTNPSEEQTYRETMRGIRSFTGWTLVLPNQRTILLPALSFKHQGRCQYNSPQINGCAGNLVNLL